MRENVKEGPALSGTVQEVQGWFEDDAMPQAGIAGVRPLAAASFR